MQTPFNSEFDPSPWSYEVAHVFSDKFTQVHVENEIVIPKGKWSLYLTLVQIEFEHIEDLI